MNEGWKCPVCGRGVAPSEKSCDHGGSALPPPKTDRLPGMKYDYTAYGGYPVADGNGNVTLMLGEIQERPS